MLVTLDMIYKAGASGQFFNEIPNKSSKVCIMAFNEVAAVISPPLDVLLSNEVKERNGQRWLKVV